ncbi:MAG: ribosome biogenesis GTPase Der, partial [Clostridiales Family XIII bacterium]|nr:ribosome biogenesis GTPase Der [Clostridiales Family XIII bacterium]
MDKKPIIAVVGRPNVGKSTFFNRIVGKRISIVEDTPGVTRDRIYAEAEWSGVSFALIDTGGIEPQSEDVIFSQMRAQAEIAMDTADAIVFMLDGKDGLTASDRDVADMLLRTRKPVILVVNKVDTAALPDNFYDFYELGLGEPLAVSAANMFGLGEAMDRIVDALPRGGAASAEEEAIGLAVIGKPNVGKSSLVNALLGEDRVIVSEIAGTTRDSIDTPFERDGERYILIDTAGLRRRSKVSDDIERYSVIRAVAAIERSDVCLLMLDAR